MPQIEVNGASLYYEADGAPGKPALLLIHAGIATLRMWDGDIDVLSEHHRVVRFDTRGFGRSDAENVEFSNRADAIAVLDHLNIETATLIGCSRGGAIAIDVALEFPDRIAGLVVIGSGPSGFPEVELTDAEEALFDSLDEAYESGDWMKLNRLETELWDFGPTRTIAALDPDFVATAYALNLANLRHAEDEPIPVPLDPPAYDRVDTITVPTLVMVGEADITPSLLQFDYLLTTIPGAEGHRFTDAAHLPSVEKPDEFRDRLVQFLETNAL